MALKQIMDRWTRLVLDLLLDGGANLRLSKDSGYALQRLPGRTPERMSGLIQPVHHQQPLLLPHARVRRIHLLHQRGNTLPVCPLSFLNGDGCHNVNSLTISNVRNSLQHRVSIGELFQLGLQLGRFGRNLPGLCCIVGCQRLMELFKRCYLFLLGCNNVVVLLVADKRICNAPLNFS